MITLLITCGVIVSVVFMMSIGVIFGRKPLSEGSCCNGPGLKAGCAGCEKYETNGRPPGCQKK